MPLQGMMCEDWQATKSSLKERFRELLQLSKWTDCTFSVGLEAPELQIFKCHKLVLAVSSPVFEALFFGTLADSTNKVIDLPDIEPKIFRLFLEYVYSDTLNLKSIDEAGGLLYVAKKYLMPKLSETCVEYLIDQTCLNTLPDVLSIAEAFEEEVLISNCVKILSRLPCSVWSTLALSMRSSTVLQLVSEESLGMSEAELWVILADWADQECQSQGLLPSPENKTNLLRSSGILSKVRFLTFSLRDVLHFLCEPLIPLTTEEVQSIRNIVQAKAMGLPTAHSLPPYFSQATEKRISSKLVEWHCPREVNTCEKLCINKTRFDTAIISTSRVLVVGFEVSTRFVTFQNSIRRVSLDSYDENILLTVRDKYGNAIAKKLHANEEKFNSYQNITLSRPLWVEANEKYFICFELPQQQYCLYSYKTVAYGKGACLTFFDDVNSSSGDVSKGGFIRTVMYNL